MLVGGLCVLSFVGGFLLAFIISKYKIKSIEERIEALEHIMDDLIHLGSSNKE